MAMSFLLEPLAIHGMDRRAERVSDVLAGVGSRQPSAFWRAKRAEAPPQTSMSASFRLPAIMVVWFGKTEPTSEAGLAGQLQASAACHRLQPQL